MGKMGQHVMNEISEDQFNNNFEKHEPRFSDIWKTLSAVDCSKNIDKKMNLSYLSWAWAWATLMDYYPDAQYSFKKEVVFDDGSMEVECSITIHGHTRFMWLPVMDHRNNAIKNPDARKISDTKMRCLVKCIAMFGLGLYIYAGEDIPTIQIKKENTVSGVVPKMTKVDKAANYFNDLLDSDHEEATEEATNVRIAKLAQKAWSKLSNDEQIAVNEVLKGRKMGKKQYNNVLREYLSMVIVE